MDKSKGDLLWHLSKIADCGRTVSRPRKIPTPQQRVSAI
jgi:hypothetical protein